MKQNDFHKQVRIVYRAMRKLYGKEKVQDECLRVFKVVYPLLHKAQKSGEFGFPDVAKQRIRKIFEEWNADTFSELDILLGKVSDRLDKEFCRATFVEFCEDIMPVVMRIRKLTPRECGRLQGCDEKTIDIMESCGVSRSAQYKMYGNSITVDVLFHIFRKLFIEPEPDVVKGEVVQLSLF